MSYDSVVLAEPTLVHFWKMNEAGGSTTLADSKGSLTLSMSGISPYGLGSGGIFPADSETVMGTTVTSNIASTSSAAMGTGTRSYEFQIYINDLSIVFNVLQNGVEVSGAEDIRVNTTGKLQSNIWGGGYADLSTALSVTTAYHIVITFDGVQVQAYVNGALQTTTPRALTTTIIGNNAKVASTVTNGINGKLGKVAYYSSVLSGSAVLAHYQAALGGGLLSVNLDSQMKALNGGMK